MLFLWLFCFVWFCLLFFENCFFWVGFVLFLLFKMLFGFFLGEVGNLGKCLCWLLMWFFFFVVDMVLVDWSLLYLIWCFFGLLFKIVEILLVLFLIVLCVFWEVLNFFDFIFFVILVFINLLFIFNECVRFIFFIFLVYNFFWYFDVIIFVLFLL